MSKVEPQSEPEAEIAVTRQKAVWERPEVRRIGADEAETGIFSGPEIIVMLS